MFTRFQRINFTILARGKRKGKTLLVITIFFILHRDCTVTGQHHCSASKARHDWVFSAALLNGQKKSNYLNWLYCEVTQWNRTPENLLLCTGTGKFLWELETNVWFLRKIPEIGPEMIPQIVRLKHQAYVLGQQDYYFIKGYKKSCQHCVCTAN